MSFSDLATKHQLAWRQRQQLALGQNGTQNGQTRPWILPAPMWEEGLWGGLRSHAAHGLTNYLHGSGVQKHEGVHNLKSSWMHCANLYFPFRRDMALLAGFLRAAVCPQIKEVTAIELEYDAGGNCSPSQLLGEPQGQRGRNQTSPDVAFLFSTDDGQSGIVLTENKYTEKSFYTCSGRKANQIQLGHNRSKPTIHPCLQPFGSLYQKLSQDCYQQNWARGQRANRRYWGYLTPTAHALASLRRCPAACGGYQLLRQQALAEALAQKGMFDLIISAVAYDNRNRELIACLKSAGVADFTTGWGALFQGRAIFASFTHQAWVNWVASHDKQGQWANWLEYVKDRYIY